MRKINLNNKLEMPVLGLGTYPLNKIHLVRTVLYAYSYGCRSFDTSSAYGNEKWLGLALKILRFFGANDIFITSKLSNFEQRSGNIKNSLFNTMNRLGVKQLDLYLMHWPNPETYLDCWKQMELLYKAGYVKAIGVCNFHEHHLKKLFEIAEIIPVINQIELHPLLSQERLVDFCNKHSIRVESYSPLARMDPKLINSSILKRLAEKYSKTVPQIILRWNIQKNIITIPKSGSKNRIRENFSVFDFNLSESEICDIDKLNENYRVRYNPDTVDFKKV